MHTSAQTTWEQVRERFRQIWGYDDFRSPQGEIVSCLLAHHDALVVMPTGGGKSVCFQLPALMRSGVTLVVSPLVALMENQVRELQEKGQRSVALLHSELPAYQRHQILGRLEHKQLKILYLSPETLLTEAVWKRLCLADLQVNGLILDEAHCLVQWGETFRPAYHRLGAIRPALLQAKPPGTSMPIAAFTATADPQAQQTIAKVLQLQNPQTFLLNPYRSNLRLAVQTVWTPRGRRQQLLRFIQKHPQQTGLVYVRTRRDSENLADWLSQQGYKVTAYHAGLSPQERRSIESAWLSGTLTFVVCTSAFGMGINKPDVRWVMHFHAPTLLSEYVQEVGRAGRDGKPAEALTLISERTGLLDPDDRQRHQFFLDKMRSQQQTAQQLIRQLPKTGEANSVSRSFKDGAIALALLHSAGQLTWQDPFHYVIHSTTTPKFSQNTQAGQQMLRFLNTKDCRWQFLLNAFGFTTDAIDMQCGHCDRCLQGQYEE